MSRSVRYRLIVTIVCLLAGAMPQAFADSGGVTLGQSGTRSGKLWRGLVNVATGVLELPRQMWVQTLTEEGEGVNPFTALIDGAVIGGFKGVFSAIARTGSGAYDVLTFPLNAPSEFGPLYRPATVFDAPWDVSPTRRR